MTKPLRQTNRRQSSSYLKSNDKTKSDGKKLPVEQWVVSIVVSVRFVSTKQRVTNWTICRKSEQSDATDTFYSLLVKSVMCFGQDSNWHLHSLTIYFMKYGFFFTNDCLPTPGLHACRQSADTVPAHGVFSVVKWGVRQGEVDISIQLIIKLVLVEQARQKVWCKGY